MRKRHGDWARGTTPVSSRSVRTGREPLRHEVYPCLPFRRSTNRVPPPLLFPSTNLHGPVTPVVSGAVEPDVLYSRPCPRSPLGSRLGGWSCVPSSPLPFFAATEGPRSRVFRRVPGVGLLPGPVPAGHRRCHGWTPGSHRLECVPERRRGSEGTGDPFLYHWLHLDLSEGPSSPSPNGNRSPCVRWKCEGFTWSPLEVSVPAFSVSLDSQVSLPTCVCPSSPDLVTGLVSVWGDVWRPSGVGAGWCPSLVLCLKTRGFGWETPFGQRSRFTLTFQVLLFDLLPTPRGYRTSSSRTTVVPSTGGPRGYLPVRRRGDGPRVESGVGIVSERCPSLVCRRVLPRQGPFHSWNRP